MEEEFLFYWSLWLLFCIVFFFIHTIRLRRVFLGFILLSIISVSFSLPTWQITINLNMIVWLLLSVYLLSQYKQTVKIIFFSCIFACFYIALLWWKMITPVWFMYLNGMEISLLACLLVGLLCGNFFERVMTLLIGSTIGNFAYEGMLVYMKLDTQVGHLSNYMYLHFALLILLFIYAIKRAMNYVYIHIKEVS